METGCWFKDSSERPIEKPGLQLVTMGVLGK